MGSKNCSSVKWLQVCDLNTIFNLNLSMFSQNATTDEMRGGRIVQVLCTSILACRIEDKNYLSYESKRLYRKSRVIQTAYRRPAYLRRIARKTSATQTSPLTHLRYEEWQKLIGSTLVAVWTDESCIIVRKDHNSQMQSFVLKA